ncbi:3D domain-containing protein [Desulfosarcina variabilis str. Montpellier]|uniref:3D domain-containing protein n=1 Tax=Desulfosarcina variabilis TaxID=2300 RepID=UPI003AFB0382
MSLKLLWNSLRLMICLLLLGGCATNQLVKNMEVTAYCGCGECCNWERGSWKYLKLNFWNRYINAGPQKGQPYSGLTASGTKPHEPQPGLFSLDSLKKPWMIPIRIIFFPWLLLPEDGTLAADTRYYPFGTRIYVPGYGYGVVEDRGGAIKGQYRLDAYFNSHGKALKWGRQKLTVEIER